jgi:DNA-binding MarR family transcriptional regulator
MSLVSDAVTEKSSGPYLFGDLLALARQSWVTQMASRLEQRGYHDYRRSDAAAMRLLRRHGLSIGELGAALGVTRQGARKLTDGLERRGYVRTEQDRRDSRRLNILLTKEGEAYAQAVVDVLQALNHDLAERVDPDQLAAADLVLRAALDDETQARAEHRVTRPQAPPDR